MTLPALLVEEGLALAEDRDDETLRAASSQEHLFDPGHMVALLADHLARLHSLGGAAAVTQARALDRVPLVTMADVISDARRSVSQAPEAPLAEAYSHMSRSELLEVLESQAARIGEPLEEDLVLTHGSPGPDTLMCRDGEAVGFVGWESVAVADRHRDLAQVSARLVGLIGPGAVAEFFDRYGRDPEPVRLDWWLLAAQLCCGPGTGDR